MYSLFDFGFSAKKKTSKRRASCKTGSRRNPKSGRCKKSKKSPVKRSTSKRGISKRVSYTSERYKEVKQMLRNMVMSVSGAAKGPTWVTTFKGIPGKSAEEKIANVRRVVLTCKKNGVSLLTRRGTYKSFGTLMSQCQSNVKAPVASKSPVKGYLSNLRTRLAARKAIDASKTDWNQWEKSQGGWDSQPPPKTLLGQLEQGILPPGAELDFGNRGHRRFGFGYYY